MGGGLGVAPAFPLGLPISPSLSVSSLEEEVWSLELLLSLQEVALLEEELWSVLGLVGLVVG